MAYFSFNGANRRLPGVSNSHLRHSSWIVLLLSFGHGPRGQQVLFKLTGQLKMERQQFGGAAIQNSTSGQKCGASGLVWNPCAQDDLCGRIRQESPDERALIRRRTLSDETVGIVPFKLTPSDLAPIITEFLTSFSAAADDDALKSVTGALGLARRCAKSLSYVTIYRSHPPISVTKMASKIPPELVHRIIDFLSDSPPDLRACSLVCSQWLSSSSRYIFESLTIRADPRFLDLVQFPSNSPPSPECAESADCHTGSSPAVAKHFPVLSQVTKLSLNRTKFASGADFTELISKFTALHELELGWVSCAGVQCGVWPCLPPLESLSIQGFEQSPGIVQWLSSVDYPRTRRLALHISKNAPDPTSLGVVSKFLHRLDGYLEELKLELLPSTYLKWTINLLNLGGLENLRRLRIGHGVHFYPPSTPEPLGMCRVFPTVLEIALSFTSQCQLEELTFDVDIAPTMLSSNSDWFLNTILTSHNVEPIPIVRFHVLGNGRSCGTVAGHCGQFASFMRERGFIGRNIIYSAEDALASSVDVLSCLERFFAHNGFEKLRDGNRSCVEPCWHRTNRDALLCLKTAVHFGRKTTSVLQNSTPNRCRDASDLHHDRTLKMSARISDPGRTEVAICRFPSTQCGRARKGRVTGHMNNLCSANIDPIWKFDPNSSLLLPFRSDFSGYLSCATGVPFPLHVARAGDISGGSQAAILLTPWFCDSVIVIAPSRDEKQPEVPSPQSRIQVHLLLLR
ncbi:hypothetical protein B0H14DRAFT_3142003 [Mycena olivaceomarginata]|nr:hypothetical protein B0H14DRAFT_3142003 [Mycena olivaceomarginata]